MESVRCPVVVGRGAEMETLLDVGCGGGFALLLAAGRAAVVSGLDAAAAMLDIAREPGSPRRPDATYGWENVFRYLIARV